MTEATIVLRACAKINLTLEVVGRRPDGHHDLVSVMQTVALADEVELLPGDDGLSVSADAAWDLPSGADNLIMRALERFRQASGNVNLRAAVRLTKRIPPASGLGGGSSDAAATLRGLVLWASVPVADERLAHVAASLGSDVSFFLRGGTQLAEGRGERLTPLLDISERWLVLMTPELGGERKTERLFGLLPSTAYSDGHRGLALVEALRRGAVGPSLLWNAFDEIAGMAFPGIDACRAALISACGHAVLCGAGPSLFALADDARAARRSAATLTAAGFPAQATRTVSAAESTLVVPSAQQQA